MFHLAEACHPHLHYVLMCILTDAHHCGVLLSDAPLNRRHRDLTPKTAVLASPQDREVIDYQGWKGSENQVLSPLSIRTHNRYYLQE